MTQRERQKRMSQQQIQLLKTMEELTTNESEDKLSQVTDATKRMALEEEPEDKNLAEESRGIEEVKKMEIEENAEGRDEVETKTQPGADPGAVTSESDEKDKDVKEEKTEHREEREVEKRTESKWEFLNSLPLGFLGYALTSPFTAASYSDSLFLLFFVALYFFLRALIRGSMWRRNRTDKEAKGRPEVETLKPGGETVKPDDQTSTAETRATGSEENQDQSKDSQTSLSEDVPENDDDVAGENLEQHEPATEEPEEEEERSDCEELHDQSEEEVDRTPEEEPSTSQAVRKRVRFADEQPWGWSQWVHYQ